MPNLPNHSSPVRTLPLHLAPSSGEDINKNAIFGLWLKIWSLTGCFSMCAAVGDTDRTFCACSDFLKWPVWLVHPDQFSGTPGQGEFASLTWVNSPSSHAPTHTHAYTLWRCFSSCLPSFSSLSYSWAICLGKCCVRCVSNRTSSVPAVHLLIVSSSAYRRSEGLRRRCSLARRVLNHSLCGHLYLR